jgi:hypothetical protein
VSEYVFNPEDFPTEKGYIHSDGRVFLPVYIANNWGSLQYRVKHPKLWETKTRIFDKPAYVDAIFPNGKIENVYVEFVGNMIGHASDNGHTIICSSKRCGVKVDTKYGVSAIIPAENLVIDFNSIVYVNFSDE